MSLRTVLIANRGEIALRILRSVQELGLSGIAVHTDEDAASPHVAAADAAVRIDSYLGVDEVLRAARSAGADAVHPGYGFLSENAALASACEEAGIAFVGPPAAAIATMGDKISAREAVAARGVPVVPGLAVPGLDDAALLAGAAEIGLPLLVKPAAGGGGKGMHRVEDLAQLPAALRAARREAAGAFGDDTLFLERWIAAPRHLEVQILADRHGHLIHLGERECSLQRRHQKVIEEAPSPTLTPAQREHLGAIAVEAARAVDYVGAGTVEFIVDAHAPDEPFFLEMNTRLQVEHAVTEEVTGLDLVAAQLRVAGGDELGISQGDVQVSGHAIEARVYAEDPDAGFLPTGGEILDLALPAGVRVDHALAPGLEVSTSYDPMLAKVIAHAPTRAGALAALDRALAGTHLLGVVTNTAFLRALLALPEVAEGRLDTGLIERSTELLRRTPVADRALAVAALVHREHLDAGRPAGLWHRTDGWRLGAPAPVRVRFATGEQGTADGGVVEVALTGPSSQATAWIGETVLSLSLHPGAVVVDGMRLPLRHHATDRAVWIGLPGEDRELVLHRTGHAGSRRPTAPTLDSPMPGAVTAVLVTDGDRVQEGQAVLVVEAMKMEHTLRAPSTGTVHLHVSPGQRVTRGQELAQVDAEGTPAEPVVAGTTDPSAPDHSPFEEVPR